MGLFPSMWDIWVWKPKSSWSCFKDQRLHGCLKEGRRKGVRRGEREKERKRKGEKTGKNKKKEKNKQCGFQVQSS